MIMDSRSGGDVATTVLVIGEGAALFAAFCPSWFTVRSPFFHEQSARAGNVQAIRQGEIAATILTLGVGAAATVMTNSMWPVVGASIVSVVMILGYEYSMTHPASVNSGARSELVLWRSL